MKPEIIDAIDHSLSEYRAAVEAINNLGRIPALIRNQFRRPLAALAADIEALERAKRAMMEEAEDVWIEAGTTISVNGQNFVLAWDTKVFHVAATNGKEKE